jgi:uncharacterized protein with FMN-binding domain
MRRAVPVIAATAGALALLANFHTRPAVSSLALASPSTTLAPNSPPATAATTSAPPAPGSGASTTHPPTTHPPTTAALASRTVDGPVVSTDYGDVQVRVTMRGGQLVDVQAVKLPFDRSRSQSISAQAGPLLRSEALRAQSARIDSLSGASYTSAGYIQSLQGAIDRARA